MDTTTPLDPRARTDGTGLSLPSTPLAGPPPAGELPEEDEPYRPHVPPDSPDLLARRLASWLVPTLVTAAQRLDEARQPVLPPVAHGSVALGVLEAVWTPRVDAATTQRVVGRLAAAHGTDADAGVLLAAISAAGGEERWASAHATRHRVLPSPGAPLKASAARAGAQVLHEAGVGSAAALRALLAAARERPSPAAQDEERFPRVPQDLRLDPALAQARERYDAIRSAWCAVPGQASGRSWHRLLLLVGAEDVVPDEDVRRFVSRWHRRFLQRRHLTAGAARASSVPDRWTAADLLETAAGLAGMSPRQVDHLAWRSELLRSASARRPVGADGTSVPEQPAAPS
ncbi:hypothetical protein [Pseudokineococcus sp. 1T1Z-3]|uniref:hypothetical protein n=1 Tax=Pseudokineococcus sp. 1T1Z-3 TaxID=3132745 RepID=UPI0030B03BF7